MIQFFRVISVLEGLSYLTILSVTLGVISRDYVFYLGMSHGVLFGLYLLLSLVVATKKDWSLVVWFLIFMASIVPFAFILVDLYLKKNYAKDNAVDVS